MPRTYDPEVECTFEPYEEQPYYTAKMVECKDGNWIPLKAFQDETNRLNQSILRLRNQLEKQNEIFKTTKSG